MLALKLLQFLRNGRNCSNDVPKWRKDDPQIYRGVTRLVLGMAVLFGVVAMMCVTMLSLSSYGDPSAFSDTASMQMAD